MKICDCSKRNFLQNVDHIRKSSVCVSFSKGQRKWYTQMELTQVPGFSLMLPTVTAICPFRVCPIRLLWGAFEVLDRPVFLGSFGYTSHKVIWLSDPYLVQHTSGTSTSLLSSISFLIVLTPDLYKIKFEHFNAPKVRPLQAGWASVTCQRHCFQPRCWCLWARWDGRLVQLVWPFSHVPLTCLRALRNTLDGREKQ